MIDKIEYVDPIISMTIYLRYVPGLGAFVPDLVIIEDKEFDATIFCGFWATWVDTFSTVDPNFCSVGV